MGKETMTMKAHPTLIPTGDASCDMKCKILWIARRYDKLIPLIIDRISKIDDYEPRDDELQMLRTLRRNEILTYVVQQVREIDIPFNVELMGSNIDDVGCRYNSRCKVMSITEYLSNPDALLCDSCSATYRKYFCDVIIRPR